MDELTENSNLEYHTTSVVRTHLYNRDMHRDQLLLDTVTGRSQPPMAALGRGTLECQRFSSCFNKRILRAVNCLQIPIVCLVWFLGLGLGNLCVESFHESFWCPCICSKSRYFAIILQLLPRQKYQNGL